MNPSLFNAEFHIAREVEVGDEDGTPITDIVTVVVPGWFDESLSGMRAAQSDRDSFIPTAKRRAVFFSTVDADMRTSDEGEIIIGGGLTSEGRWMVAKNELVPVPGGASHREWGLEKLEESR